MNGVFFPTMLDDASTLTFLANFPDIVAGATSIPQNGTVVTWGDHSYNVFYRNPPGRLYVLDQTAYNPDGSPIDPDLMNQSNIGLWLRAIGAGLSDTAGQIAAGVPDLLGDLPTYLKWAAIAVGAYFVLKVIG
jgi:hypothetical protein